MAAQQTAAAAGQQQLAGSRSPAAEREDPEAVKWTRYDFSSCLHDGIHWSSRMMNYYIDGCIRQTNCHNEDGGARFHVFDVHDYKKFKISEGNCSMFKSWWEPVNLFEKGYLILPISDSWMDWSLIIVCIPAKESNSGLIVLHLDPFNLHGGCMIIKKIIRYLEAEFLHLGENPAEISASTTGDLSTHIETVEVSVPSQVTNRERGILMIGYIKRFMEEAPERFTKDDMGMFKSWAGPEGESFWVIIEDATSLLQSAARGHVRRQQYEESRRQGYGDRQIRSSRHDPWRLYVPKRLPG